MRSALQRVGVALAGALLASSAVAAPASAATAALTGTVVDAADGSAVPACVTVYDTAYNWVDQACTDETGAWTTTNTESGAAYKVEVQPTDGLHLSGWAPDAADFDSAATVTAPAAVTARTTRGAVVSGHLSRADGSSADGANVALYPVGAPAPIANAYVSDGAWTALVRPGDYQVEFSSAPFRQWATGTADRGSATTFSAGTDHQTVVDDVLSIEEPVSLEGTITDGRLDRRSGRRVRHGLPRRNVRLCLLCVQRLLGRTPWPVGPLRAAGGNGVQAGVHLL